MIDLRDECENIFDLMRINSELLSNEIDECDLRHENDSEPEMFR
jgi:hypothetical protein